ncbi:hypothetical protein Micbo1qcDRAFT_170129 [Microdochium bolleyi]|uniref:MYND-type domain-containing protein n=1 Tax=Microdochium bolleyi TaxID=196109 RepID=A0A136II14_9PEZI|nr:hypothetical protein Micbo1qcDRAFT_170129 [Microdochium bolleyi]
MVEQDVVCSNCGQSGTSLPRCGRCRTLYCSRDCQAQHWPQYKRECSRSINENVAAAESLIEVLPQAPPRAD